MNASDLNTLAEEYKLVAIGQFLHEHMEKNPKVVGFIVEKLEIIHPNNYSGTDLATALNDAKERLDEKFQSILG